MEIYTTTGVVDIMNTGESLQYLLNQREIYSSLKKRMTYWKKNVNKHFKLLELNNVPVRIVNRFNPTIAKILIFAFIQYLVIFYGKKILKKFTLSEHFWIRWYRFKIHDILNEMKSVRNLIKQNNSNILDEYGLQINLDLKLDAIINRYEKR
jgi:hypothetical protein